MIVGLGQLLEYWLKKYKIMGETQQAMHYPQRYNLQATRGIISIQDKPSFDWKVAINPDTIPHQVWDVFILMLTMYYGVSVPLVVAFLPVKDSPVLVAIEVKGVHVCACVCIRVCLCACVHARVGACACVHTVAKDRSALIAIPDSKQNTVRAS